jgi:hypothetical protein
MLTGAHTTQRLTSALTFLEQYHKDDNEFLNLILRVTDDETWVSFLNVENQRALKAVDAYTLARQAEKF